MAILEEMNRGIYNKITAIENKSINLKKKQDAISRNRRDMQIKK